MSIGTHVEGTESAVPAVPEVDGLTLESELARRLGVSLDSMKRTREERLSEGEHWVRQGRKVLLTAAGVQCLLGQDLPAEKKEGGAARVRVVVAAVGDRTRRLRVLRGRVQESGAICTVFLTGRGVLANQFRVLQEIDCLPQGQRVDAYFYDGRPPKRLRL